MYWYYINSMTKTDVSQIIDNKISLLYVKMPFCVDISGYITWFNDSVTFDLEFDLVATKISLYTGQIRNQHPQNTLVQHSDKVLVTTPT